MSDKSNLENIELKNRVDTSTLNEFKTFLKIYEIQVFNKKVSDINSYAEVDNNILEKFLDKYKEIFNKKYGEKHKVYINFKTIFEIISNNFKLEKIIPSPENLNQQISFIMEKSFDEKKLINDFEKNKLNIEKDIDNNINNYINNNIDYKDISNFLKNLSISNEYNSKKQENLRKELKKTMIQENLNLQNSLAGDIKRLEKSIELDKKLKNINDFNEIKRELNIN